MGMKKENDESIESSLPKVVAIDSSRVRRLRQNGSFEPNIWIRRRMLVWRNARSDDPEKQDEARDKLWERNARRRVD
jgi:hypothetical protein